MFTSAEIRFMSWSRSVLTTELKLASPSTLRTVELMIDPRRLFAPEIELTDW